MTGVGGKLESPSNRARVGSGGEGSRENWSVACPTCVGHLYEVRAHAEHVTPITVVGSISLFTYSGQVWVTRWSTRGMLGVGQFGWKAYPVESRPLIDDLLDVVST